MTVTVPDPMIVGALLGVIAELMAMGAWLWRRFRKTETRVIELTQLADMQGDALREALNEVDRLRRRIEKWGW
jgi:hypothetical protein